MNKEPRFYRDGQEFQAQPFHYKMCGLDDIYLLNGFMLEDSEYGRGVAIHDAWNLHKAIGEHLIRHRKALSPREIKFLRKEMELTQEALAKCLGVTGQTVARYEKGETEITGPAEKLLRLVYAFHLLPENERREVAETLLKGAEAEIDEAAAGPVYFGADACGNWDKARPSA